MLNIHSARLGRILGRMAEAKGMQKCCCWAKAGIDRSLGPKWTMDSAMEIQEVD